MSQINKPNTYFNTVLYTGNGTTGHNITGVGFQPDWLWIKERSSTSSHFIYDAIRNVNVKLSSNTTDADSTVADSMTSFDSDGFTVGNNGATNESGQTYASWNWLAGGTAVSNTQGSITSSVSANTTSGFSIVSWTGTGSAGTIGTGLNATPAMIIVKNRSAVENWRVWHNKLSANDKIVQLNLTDAESSTTDFQPANNTTSVFGIGNNAQSNGSGNSIIAYCFAEKKGFSKFGKYTGNGSTDGTFVYTGFKPAMVIIKRTDDVHNWWIWDNKRDPENLVDKYLYANLSNAEGTDTWGDFLSNGFKLRMNFSSGNASGGTYIYMAFAENPLVGTNNIPATAR